MSTKYIKNYNESKFNQKKVTEKIMFNYIYTIHFKSRVKENKIISFNNPCESYSINFVEGWEKYDHKNLYLNELK